MIDAHVHVTEELLPYLKYVRCIANADCPEEYAFLKEHTFPMISAGIHPWKADVTAWEKMEPILREVPVVGEIGLDSVWCGADMNVQRRVFRRQLASAAQLGKPVILHTKGMEREILETVRQFPNRYLVHWYECGEWLKDYIALGCWFTVGPDVGQSADVKRLAQTVPLDRLLIESDGLEGIAWGQNHSLTAAEYPQAMQRHLEIVADLRNVSADELLAQMQRNLYTFIYG